MKPLTSYAETVAFSQAHPVALLYLSRPGCGVCTVVKPQVEALVDQFPDLALAEVDLDAVPEVGGQLSVFTIPALLVFVHGRETLRQARYLNRAELTARLERIFAFTPSNSSIIS